MTDIDAYMAAQKKRVRLANERAQTALARLGGEARPRRSLDDLTAEEIDRDTRMLRGVLKVWKRKRLRIAGDAQSTITLPSGRRLVYDWKTDEVIQ